MCTTKTRRSAKHDPAIRNAPSGDTLPVRDIRRRRLARPLCGEILQMPAEGESPAACDIEIDADGRPVGLF